MKEIRAAASVLKLGLQELPTGLDADALERTFRLRLSSKSTQ